MSITHQMIQYRLNSDGTIPDFLYKGNDGIGGVFLKNDPNTPPPQDIIMFGLSEYSVTVETSGIVRILTTKEELSTYLNEIFDGVTEPNPEDPEGEPVPVNVDTHVEWVWEIYQARNNLV